MSRMIKITLLLFLGVVICSPLDAQDSPLHPQDWPLPELTADTHALDSLLGKWTFVQDLHNPQYPKLKGTWTFSRGGDGFMVFDEFRTDNGSGGTAFLGETYRAYNPKTKTWSFRATQYINPQFGLSGEWDAGTTRFERGDIIDEIPKGSTISRFRFYNIKPDSFSLVGETSKDGGKTWANTMNIECVRAQN